MKLFDYLLADVKGLGKALGLTNKQIVLVLRRMNIGSCPLMEVAEYWIMEVPYKKNWKTILYEVGDTIKRELKLEKKWFSGTNFKFQPYAKKGTKLWGSASIEYSRKVLYQVIERLENEF